MNRFFALLLAAAFAIAPVAHAQIDFCFDVDASNIRMEGTMYNDTDVALATGFGIITYIGTAVRGTISEEIRHHAFTFINPDADADPGCLGSGSVVDWLTYNGRITGGNATNGYIWNGIAENSCEFGPFIRSAVIYIGSCPTNRPVMTDNSDELAPGTVIERGAAPAAAGTAAPEAFEAVAAPNPFAAGTVVQFDLPESSHVRVVVFDALGRQVAVLADEAHEAGTHAVSFEGADLPSGVYLYRVEAGARVASGQMTLVR